MSIMMSSTLFVNVMVLLITQFVLVCVFAQSRVTNITVDEDQHGLYIPERMTFDETVLFWETLVCDWKQRTKFKNKLNVYGDVYEIKHHSTCSPIPYRGCECVDCALTRDCCVDKYLHVTNKTPYMSCRVPSPQNVTVERNETSYYIIDKCPENFNNSEIKSKCENLQPLSSKDEATRNMIIYSKTSKLNYLNQFCAQCHSDDKQVAFWKTEIRCYNEVDVSESQSERDMFSLLIKNPNCVILAGSQPGPATKPATKCGPIHNVANVCNVTGKWLSYDEEIKTACALYKNYVRINEVTYRNIFCAFCNGISPTWVQDNFNNSFNCSAYVWRKLNPQFSVLFKFTTGSEVKDSTKIMKTRECPDNMVFHPVKKVCRTLRCSKGRYINNHSCVDEYETSKNVGYRVTFYLLPILPRMETRDDYQDGLHELFLQSLYKHNLFIRFKMLYSAISMVICSTNLGVNVVSEDSKIKVDFQTVVGANVSQKRVEANLLEIYNSTLEMSGLIWTILDEVIEGCKIFNASYTAENVEVPLKYKHNPDAYITVNKFTRCNQIELDTDEYRFDENSGTIKLGWSEEILDHQDYQVINGTVRICVNYSGWYQAYDKTDKTDFEDGVESVVTIVCVSLSLLALSLTFIICLSTRAYKTMPGLITIILITLIFVAQLLFLVSGYALNNQWVCRAIGLALHFFWLSVFAWKNVAAYHMYSIFTKPFEHTHETFAKYLPRYSVYGFGLPAIIIGSYVCVSSVLSQNNSIGYGRVGGACFLSREIDVGLAFALPVGLVLVGNLYFFGRAVHVIRQTPGIDKHSNKANTNHNALFMKMSIILGFTWIVGFIANIISKPFAWYTFAVLNGGIGVLIFASQTYNRIVSRYWCKVLEDFSTEDSIKTSNSANGNTKEGR